MISVGWRGRKTPRARREQPPVLRTSLAAQVPLKKAKRLLRDNKIDEAVKYLRILARDFRKTKSGYEAAKILKELEGSAGQEKKAPATQPGPATAGTTQPVRK